MVVCLFINGCTFANKQVGPKPTAKHWAYAPSNIEIHPLSRFRNPKVSDEENLIVVHIEMVDGDGFACRGVGVLKVTLIGANGQVLATESIELQDATINRQRFDPVTRTYQAHFSSIPIGLEHVTATATFTALDKTSITSQTHAIHNNH